jgi:hypothetical protein
MTKELRDKVLNFIIESWDELKVSEKDYIVNGIIDDREDEALSQFTERAQERMVAELC